MSRISMIFISLMAALAFSANAASAGSVTVHTTTPTVTVHPTVTPLVTGKNIPTGKITTRKAGGDQVLYDKTKGGKGSTGEKQEYLQFNMDAVYITSW
jgi:hypothetical protein